MANLNKKGDLVVLLLISGILSYLMYNYLALVSTPVVFTTLRMHISLSYIISYGKSLKKHYFSYLFYFHRFKRQNKQKI